jgi:L-amino acid N-acyltransferase YncA
MNTPVKTIIEIRDARPADAEGIVAVLNPIIAARCYTAFDAPLTASAEREFIRHFPERGIFHVAVTVPGGDIVGFQDVSPFADFSRAFDHVGVIGTFVELTRRREGIGTHLFSATFDAARRKGYEKILAYVRADNENGLAAYRRQGFRVVGTAARHAKIDGKYIDEIIIERFLI